MLSWTPGDPNDDSTAGPFRDPSQDLVDLNLTKLGNTNYQARVTRLVGNFSNPIDAEILENRIYVIEFGGNQGIWELTFPPAPPVITLSHPEWLGTNGFSFLLNGTTGVTYSVEVSTNLSNWFPLTNLVVTNGPVQVTDTTDTSSLTRFYRARIP
jgi:hypothetical protein